MRVSGATPNLPVDDMEAARAFVTDFLGLTTVGVDQGWVLGLHAPGDPATSIQLVTRDATAPEDSVVSVHVSDVDEAYARATERGYEIVHPLTDEPWGLRRFFVRAPGGAVLNIVAHDDEAHRRPVEARLRDDVIAWLTTVRPSGRPDSVPVWFWWDGERILIYSQPDTPKLRNLAQNPNVAVVLDDTRGGSDVVRVEGSAVHDATAPAPHEVDGYVAKYAERIRSIGFDNPEAFGNSFSAPIVVTPSRIRT